MCWCFAGPVGGRGQLQSGQRVSCFRVWLACIPYVLSYMYVYNRGERGCPYKHTHVHHQLGLNRELVAVLLQLDQSFNSALQIVQHSYKVLGPGSQALPCRLACAFVFELLAEGRGLFANSMKLRLGGFLACIASPSVNSSMQCSVLLLEVCCGIVLVRVAAAGAVCVSCHIARMLGGMWNGRTAHIVVQAVF